MKVVEHQGDVRTVAVGDQGEGIRQRHVVDATTVGRRAGSCYHPLRDEDRLARARRTAHGHNLLVGVIVQELVEA
jgi:hypothetical protein